MPYLPLRDKSVADRVCLCTAQHSMFWALHYSCQASLPSRFGDQYVPSAAAVRQENKRKREEEEDVDDDEDEEEYDDEDE